MSRLLDNARRARRLSVEGVAQLADLCADMVPWDDHRPGANLALMAATEAAVRALMALNREAQRTIMLTTDEEVRP